MSNQLSKAIYNLGLWQKKEIAAGHSTDKRCLEACRWALQQEDLILPFGNGVNYASNFAIDNGKALMANPAHWHWKQVHSPLVKPCLVYFKLCGFIPSKFAWAGHVGILSNGIIYSNKNYKMNWFWSSRIIAAFVPLV